MRAKLALLLSMSVWVNSNALADIALGAPGVPSGSQVATKVPFKNIVSLPNGYKFVFSGIEAKGNTAGAPGSSGTNGNGGQFHVSATVSLPNKIKTDKIEFRDVQDFNTAPWKKILLTQDITYRATTTPINVTLQWDGQGNAHKPDGIFNILGEYQKQPPVPTGSLNFAVGQWMLQPPGMIVNPDGLVNITRE